MRDAPFEPGDRVVAIDTDMSRMIHPAGPRAKAGFRHPDGVLQKNIVYHVKAVKWSPGGQGLFITGLRSLYRGHEIAWGAVRFRRLDMLKGHAPLKEQETQPETVKATAMAHSVDVPARLPQGTSA